MAEVEFNGHDGRPLCFKHAVKMIVEKDEDITISLADLISDENDYTGYLGQTCVECYPEDEFGY